MAAREPIFPRLRERVEDVRRRVKERIGREGAATERRIIGGRGEIQIGRGALIERTRKRIAEATERVAEVKPGIVPKIGEILAAWYPGKRLLTIITPKGEIVRPGEITQREAEKEKVPKPPAGEGAHY